MRKNLEKNSPRKVFDEMLEELELASPVEFQLPDRLKKKKPMSSYTPIKRNMYLIKKFRKRTEDDGIFCFCSPSSGSTSVCGRDCHCGMLLSSCSTSCNCGNSCLNKPFQLRTVKNMKLVKTEKCGLGLIADEDVQRGEFVIEYVGEVIDDKTCEERLWEMKRRGETNFYLCEINRDMVIDATYKGNKSRFINHSCQPNTEMQKWRVDGETRIGIFATCDIRKGEEMTYDYRFVQFGADQDCHCGALGCRGKLGNKPGKPKLPPSDAALKLVACEVAAASSPIMKAYLKQKQLHVIDRGQDYSTRGLENGCSENALLCRRMISVEKCIGQMVQILRPLEDRRYSGWISNFDSSSRKHTITFEDRHKEDLDMSKEEWDFL